MNRMLDKRAQILLKTLIERYIAEGQPVGSRTLSKYSGLDLSPATIRNVMADLEDMGLIASPHTAAGRVPTPLGYRFLVDSLLDTEPLARARRLRRERSEQYVISGERNLLSLQDLSQDMGRLRQLFELFEHKTSLLQILDVSLRGQGVQIFIGGESGFRAPDEVSVVTSPYKVDGEVVGTVGVIGPTRMAYDRVIPIVDVTAKLLSSALSQH